MRAPSGLGLRRHLQITDRCGIVPADGAEHRRPRVGLRSSRGFSNQLWQFTLVHCLMDLGTPRDVRAVMAEARTGSNANRGLSMTLSATAIKCRRARHLAAAASMGGIQHRRWRTTLTIAQSACSCGVAMTICCWCLRACRSARRREPKSHNRAPPEVICGSPIIR